MRMCPSIHTIHIFTSVAFLGAVAVSSVVAAEQAQPSRQEAFKSAPAPAPVYVIGPEDVLTITIYGQDAHSGDVVVRPDGKISKLLIDEVQAVGLTPLQLRDALTKAYSKFFAEPMILVDPKQINSRKVGIVGLVYKPGEYSLNGPMDILQLLTKAGGPQDYADTKNIRLIRRRADETIETIVFNYDKLFIGKGVTSIPMLQPGDQVIVK